uniref:Beta-2-microglobulin n=1 Tax=Cyprinus carpio TaxID=7962 RepID=A0A8C1JYQ5_CYPCA
MFKLAVVALVLLSASCFAKQSAPKVQVYSRNPGEYGKKNVLICYVSGFHPPDITIELLKNKVEIPGSQQTDLAFEQGWQFHLTKFVDFTPQPGEEYSCRVRHMTDTKSYTWGENTSEVFILIFMVGRVRDVGLFLCPSVQPLACYLKF